MKLIEKILDDYYTIKLLDYFKNHIAIVYFLDFKYVYERPYNSIKVKKPKYKDYQTIIKFKKGDSCLHLCNINNFRKECHKIIQQYDKEE
jgi:hypothetical protein